VLIINLFLVVLVSAEVRINEVELNPEGSDSGNEWIELYSNSEINLTGFKIINNDNESINLSQNINGYYIISFQGQFLDNSDERLFLYNSSNLVFETPLISDSGNDNKNWQYCNGNWSFVYMTKNHENNCSSAQNNPPQNTSNTEQTSDSKISVKIEFDEDEIINGDEFSIDVKAKNLKNEKYNLKIWIKKEDNDNIISERYGEDSSGKKAWKSGNYYAYDFFEGTGNKTETLDLRIKKDYADFSGDAEICFKLEGFDEDCESIEVLEGENKKQEKEDSDKNNTEEIKTTVKISASNEIIKLGGSEFKEKTAGNNDINNKNPNNNIIYESKTEKIKAYSVIGFAVLCLGLVILVLFNKLR